MHSLPNDNTYWVRPGLLMAGEYPAAADVNRAREKLRQYLDSGVTFFLDLTHYGESILLPYEPVLRELGADFDGPVEYVRQPVVDGDVPARNQMRQILDAIDAAIDAGHTVYVHCLGGVGRTGTVVATYLVHHGRTADEALSQLAEWWSAVEKRSRHPRSPENDRQEAFVRQWKP